MFDVAVIGRGLIGSAAARHLVEAGLRVVAIGPDEPTEWSTWTGPFASHFDESRITRISDRHPTWSEVARRSIERYADIEARSGIGFHHPVGLVLSTPELPYWLDTSRANGAAVEAVEADRVAETTGITLRDDAPVAYEAAPAGFINPRRLVAAQTTLARRAGASIVAEPATSLTGGRAVGFAVGGSWGSIEADRVVVATGAFGHGLLGAGADHQLGLVRRPRTVLLAELLSGRSGPPELFLGRSGPPELFLGRSGPPELFPGRSGPPELGLDPLGDRPLPALILRDQAPEGEEPISRGLLASPVDPRLSSVYWVPPVTYPNGRSYLKIGGVLADDPVFGAGPGAHAELIEWFHGSGDPVDADALKASLEALLPGRPILSTGTVPCVYTGTTSGLPIIDRLEEGLVVALGGNGAAAKSSDELGRLAGALVTASGEGDGALGPVPDPTIYGLATAAP